MNKKYGFLLLPLVALALGLVFGFSFGSTKGLAVAIDRGGAIYIENGSYTIRGGETTGSHSWLDINYGGGVYVKNGKLNMTGGGISGFYVGENWVRGDTPAGGGVYLDNSTFIMDGGAITGNIVGTPFDSDDMDLLGCYNPWGKGGGVYVGAGSTFTMNRGTISSNMTWEGGAIFVDSGGVFNMYGGNISNNLLTPQPDPIAGMEYQNGVFVEYEATMNYYGGIIQDPIYVKNYNGREGDAGVVYVYAKPESPLIIYRFYTSGGTYAVMFPIALSNQLESTDFIFINWDGTRNYGSFGSVVDEDGVIRYGFVGGGGAQVTSFAPDETETEEVNEVSGIEEQKNTTKEQEISNLGDIHNQDLDDIFVFYDNKKFYHYPVKERLN